MSRFHATGVSAWAGRYSRIAGRQSVFHLKWIDGEWWPTIVWYFDDSRYTCPAIEGSGVRDLAAAVAEGKRHLGGSGGGTFQINEFGQVLVPASDGSGERVLVGEWCGEVLFEDPENGNTIVLSDDEDLCCGDEWLLPYLGMKYQLHKGSRIYFYRVSADGGDSEYANPQDNVLVQKLRQIRRSGSMRFVVNPFGIVLTKRPVGNDWSEDEEWEAVYVGKIDPEKWFKKEV